MYQRGDMVRVEGFGDRTAVLWMWEVAATAYYCAQKLAFIGY
jgi:hypothetical protein